MKLIKIAGTANANLYRHPETGMIYLWLSKKGKGRIQRSTGTDNLAQARKIADEIKYEFLGTRNPRLGRKLIKELFPEWLETKRLKRPRTFRRYELSWENLKPYIEDLGADDINDIFWSASLIPAVRIKKPTYHFFNDRKCLRGFLLAMRDQAVIDIVPKLPNPDVSSEIGKVYPDKEITRLFEHAGPDLKFQMLMALEMFMRKGEILLLALDRINVEGRYIALRKEDTKTNKSRDVPISRAVWALIKPRLGHESGYLFPSNTGEARPIDKDGNQTAWEGAKRRAKVTGRFHDLRHTALSKALTAKSAPIAKICLVAGLSLETAERVYLHTTPEQLQEVALLMGEKWS